MHRISDPAKGPNLFAGFNHLDVQVPGNGYNS